MDRRITSIVHKTRSILRFYCRCGELGIARLEDAGKNWTCAKCREVRQIPDTSETVLRILPEEMFQVSQGDKKDKLDPEVKRWGDDLVKALRVENIGVGTAEVHGYYCLKVHLSEDLDEYLRLTSIDIDGSRYFIMATSAGRMKDKSKAVQLLEYVTQFAKVDMTRDEVRLHWLLPIKCLSSELLKEVGLSMIFDTSMIRTTILS